MSKHPQEIEGRLRALEDQVELQSMMGRYGRLLDAKDWEGLAQMFCEDLTTRHDVVTEPMHGRDAFIRFVSNAQPRMRYCQHYITNVEVSLDSDEAQIRAFVLAMHDVSDGDRNTIVPAGGDYEVHVRKEDGCWRIDQLTVHETWLDHRTPAIYAP